MKIRSVTLRRIYNLGNYENIQPELVADLDEKEDPQTALRNLELELNNYITYTRIGKPIPENKKQNQPIKDGDRFKRLEMEDDDE